MTDVFSMRLRTARKKRGMSQQVLADRIGVHFTVISQFERNRQKPYYSNLLKLADALDVAVDYLMGRVTKDQALVGADEIHRDWDRLKTSDRDIVKDFIGMLASRGQG